MTAASARSPLHPTQALPWGLGLWLGVSLALSGCVVPPDRGGSPSEQTAASCQGDLGATGNTRLAAIQQMVSDGKPYAALAELDALGGQTPKAQLVRAEALRRVDRAEQARQIYTTLTQTCLNGEALHGLGLLAGHEGRLEESLRALSAARQALPTNAAIRNDLGYALLMNQQWADAQFELLTAQELAPNDSRVQRNLVLLALAQDKAPLARELSARFGLDAATQERLRSQALRLSSVRPPANPASAPADATTTTSP